MKKKIMILVIVLSVVALNGCLNTKTTTTTNSSILALANVTIPQNAFKTMIISDQYGDAIFSPTVTIIVGNLTDIRHPNKNDVTYQDILIFEDGKIVSTYGAKNFQWKRNKIHLVIIEGTEIRKVVVSE